MPKQEKRIIFRVLPLTERGKLKGWKVTRDEHETAVFYHHQGATKRAVVRAARVVAKQHQPSQLFVHGRDGRIQSEATFPRSSDPRRSKG